MILKNKDNNDFGYNPVTEIEGVSSEIRMDFGLLKLSRDKYESYMCNQDKERVFMLLDGEVQFEWGNKRVTVKRTSLFEEKPSALNVPAGLLISISVISEFAELAVFRVINKISFETFFYDTNSVSESKLKAGSLGDVAERTIRSVIDDRCAPKSNLCVGEIINNAGRWSSYPPHYHPQYEIYHYRFNHINGFGYSEQGQNVYKVHSGDTAVIPPDVTHPQVAAPGYPMFYLWAIPHLEEDRFTDNSRIFDLKHKWIMEDL